MCTNMWLIAGLCQKCRSTKTLPAVSLPTRHTHQTLPVAVTMCHFKASCLCSLFICLSSPVSVCCLCGFRLNCRTELQQTQTSDPTGCQPNAAPTRVLLCHLSALLRLLRLHCTALFHVDSMTFEAFMPGQCANCARSVEVQTIFGTVYKMKFNCIASRRNNLHS